MNIHSHLQQQNTDTIPNTQPQHCVAHALLLHFLGVGVASGCLLAAWPWAPSATFAIVVNAVAIAWSLIFIGNYCKAHKQFGIGRHAPPWILDLVLFDHRVQVVVWIVAAIGWLAGSVGLSPIAGIVSLLHAIHARRTQQILEDDVPQWTRIAVPAPVISLHEQHLVAAAA